MISQDFFGIFTIAQAWAAGGAEHHTPSITEVIFPTLNFLIYLAIIIKFALPPVRSFLKNRRDEVVATMTQASAKKAAAQALVDEYRAKLAALDQLVRSLQATLRDEGERDKAKLLGEANAMAAKVKADASILADQEVKMARQKIRDRKSTRLNSSHQSVSRMPSSA